MLFTLVFLLAVQAAATTTTPPYSPAQLREFAFVAKQNLALGNVLDPFTRLDDAIQFDWTVADGLLQSAVFNTIDRHPFASLINNPVFSIEYFHVPKEDQQPTNAAEDIGKLCTQDPLRAAQLVLFSGADYTRCGPYASARATAIELLTPLVHDIEEEEQDTTAAAVLDDNDTETQLLLYVLEDDMDRLLHLAWATNHAVAHLTLAQYFYTRRQDVERAAIHLLQTALATSHLVLNAMPLTTSPAPPAAASHVRLSQLEHKPELAESAHIMSSARAFEEYRVHLEGLAGGEFPEYGVDLGDLYAAGVPELGIAPDAERAMLAYERAAAAAAAVDGMDAGLATSRLAALHRDNATAFELYAQAHALGEPSAALGLAVFYRDGTVVAKNASRALELFLEASAAGYSEADYQASKLMLQDGADQHLLRAARAGHVLACIDHAQHLLYALDFEGAVPWLLRAVRTDWTDFVPYDSKRALAHYQHKRVQAALHVYQLAGKVLWQPDAVMNEAFLWEQQQHGGLVSLFTTADRALELYTRAAKEWGVGEAYRKLGEHHYRIDVGQAAYWYRKGAEAGDAESAWHVGALRLQGGVPGLLPGNADDFDLAIRLDPDAYWAVHAYYAWLWVQAWASRLGM